MRPKQSGETKKIFEATVVVICMPMSFSAAFIENIHM